ncbi:MAG TPA: transcriptional regulator [Pyrinomonadaceae bacterium]|nr:transcriptional regulator [Pyrinomonadaceae bacterium]
MDLFKEITELDKLLHEPSRLAILTALAGCKSADFLFLQRLTGMSKGNLSGHLSKLEDAGLIEIQKGFIGKIPNTNINLTKAGLTAINEHWKTLEELRNGAKAWKPNKDTVG